MRTKILKATSNNAMEVKSSPELPIRPSNSSQFKNIISKYAYNLGDRYASPGEC